MKLRALVSFGAFAAIVLFALGFFASLGVRVRPPVERINVSMEVPDINGLVVGANVLLRGVPVGKVSGIKTTVDSATVDFYIDAIYRIPVDSEVRLENLSALGESYLGLVPLRASGPVLQDGQRIAAEAVIAPPSIPELADSVTRMLRQLDPAALERIIEETDAALPDPTMYLPNLERASMLLRKMATTRDGKGEALLSNFQSLLQNAQFVGPILADLVPDIYQIGIGVQRIFLNQDGSDAYQRPYGSLVRRGGPQTLLNFSTFIGRLQSFLDHRSGDIKVLTQSMLPYVNDISGALMNLDTGQLLGNLLEAVPPDGVVTLRVAIP